MRDITHELCPALFHVAFFTSMVDSLLRHLATVSEMRSFAICRLMEAHPRIFPFGQLDLVSNVPALEHAQSKSNGGWV